MIPSPPRQVAGPATEGLEPTIWPRGRVGMVVITLVTAAATAALAAWAGDGPGHVLAGAGFVAATVAALESPRVVWLPVLVGVGLSWSLLEGREGTEALVMVPVIVGVVATAELIAVVARLEMIVRRNPVDDLARVGLLAAVAAVGTLLTLVLGSIEGPGGFAALALAAGACVVLAVLLAQTSRT